ncbi:MAG: hypothetical protein KY445_03105 [Armatimonadetes bacterium]|nr:hypothetical protein [Armatimonadota bacterium]
MNSTSSTSSKGFPLKSFGILLLLAFLGGVGAYFYGLSQGRAALATQKTEFETQIQSAREETQKSKDEVVTINNRVHLLDAQNRLYRAAVALDRRNFGIANTALQGAAAALGQVKESPDVPFARVQSLAAALQKTNINVAANLENQRARLLAFAEEMEDLTPSAAPLEAEATSGTSDPSGESAGANAGAGSGAGSGGTAPTEEEAVPSENAVSSDNATSADNAVSTENSVSNSVIENSAP